MNWLLDCIEKFLKDRRSRQGRRLRHARILSADPNPSLVYKIYCDDRYERIMLEQAALSNGFGEVADNGLPVRHSVGGCLLPKVDT